MERLAEQLVSLVDALSSRLGYQFDVSYVLLTSTRTIQLLTFV